MSESEQQITESSSAAGDKAALDKLVEEHFDYLYRYAFRYFRTDERAEEVVQEAFLAALEGIQRFEGKAKIRTWLTGILPHKIMDSVRRASKAEMVSLDAEVQPDPIAGCFDDVEHWVNDKGPRMWGGAPDNALVQKQFFAALESCLAHLPRKVRQIFLLRELDGLEREEICSQLGLTSTNVGVILHRARISLQQCLQTSWLNDNWKEV